MFFFIFTFIISTVLPQCVAIPAVFWQFDIVGSDVGHINEVALRWAWLVLGWVTISGSTPGAGNLSQSNQLPRSTQTGHPSVGRCNEYRPKGGDALRLGSEGRYGSCLVAGKIV